jgi:type II secretory pathway pseudopilin PulG
VSEVPAKPGLSVWASFREPERTSLTYRRTRRAAGERGYTTLEPVIVLSLIGILLVMGLPSIRSALAREELDGWARAIVYDIAAGQQAAMTRRTNVTASFQSSAFIIVVYGGGALRSDTLPSHISFGGALQAVTFDRRGVPSGDLSITVTSSLAGKTYTITIQQNTGRVGFDG